MQPLVSLITPCFNGEKYINNYINNVIRQTYPSVEVIFINDGSKDKSEELVMENSYKIKEKNYTFVYYAQENKGVSAAINAALKLAKGEYIMLLDMDDVLYSDAIKTKAEYLTKHADHGMVRNNGYYIFERYKKRKWKFERNGQISREDKIFEDLLLARTHNWPSSYMIRSESLFTIYPDRKIYASRYGQNLQFMLPIAYYYKTGYIKECLMEYFIHDGSLSHSRDVSKTLEMFNGYESNRKEIVNQMNLDNADKEKYLKEIEKKYLKDRLRYFIKINNRILFDTQYQLLKQNNWLTRQDNCLNVLFKVKGFSFVYRAYCHYIYVLKQTIV